MKIARLISLSVLTGSFFSLQPRAQTTEPIIYGDFNEWSSRHITESVVIGGKQRVVYDIGPSNDTIHVDTEEQHSPWATNNSYIKVAGVTKAKNAVYPSYRTQTDKCAKICSQADGVKVLGFLNMKYNISGCIFLGEMSDGSSEFSKMDVGIPYTKRPHALSLDYKIDCPNSDVGVKFSNCPLEDSAQQTSGAIILVLLQRRWETPDGTLHAKRVGTGGCVLTKPTAWVNGYTVPITYGDYSQADVFCDWLGLRYGDEAYFARNSKGDLVPVEEDGWDTDTATPTHAIVMISTGSTNDETTLNDFTLYVDNVAFKF